MKQPDAALLLWLAEQSRWILSETNLNCERDELGIRYRYQLNLIGLANHRGKVALEQMCKRLVQSIPKFSIAAHGLDNTQKLYPVLYQLVTRGQGQPSLHLLVIRMLGLSVKEFLNTRCESFETGPWPCLNPVRDSRNQDVIQRYEKVVTRKGRLFGVFACGCGYTYSRSGPDCEGASRFMPAQVY